MEQQPAICATLLSPQVTKGQSQSDLCTLNETDVANAEHLVKALKPMKDATTLISEESSPTVCLIAPLQAQLCQETTGNIAESSITRDIKKAINEDLSKRYTSDLERRTLRSASALDPRFKGLPFLSEDDVAETFGRVVAEAASLEVNFILLYVALLYDFRLAYLMHNTGSCIVRRSLSKNKSRRGEQHHDAQHTTDNTLSRTL